MSPYRHNLAAALSDGMLRGIVRRRYIAQGFPAKLEIEHDLKSPYPASHASPLERNASCYHAHTM